MLVRINHYLPIESMDFSSRYPAWFTNSMMTMAQLSVQLEHAVRIDLAPSRAGDAVEDVDRDVGVLRFDPVNGRPDVISDACDRKWGPTMPLCRGFHVIATCKT